MSAAPHIPKRIAIVGGGTAGWLAALLLGDARAWPKAQGECSAPEITVIESSKIGTVGVGEGTTAVFRQMLKHFDLDERAFIAATGATIKYGIRHRDWKELGHHYDGPIDDVEALASGLHEYCVASGRPVENVHLFANLMERQRAPFAEKSGREVAASPFLHAYHFDQAKAGNWLRDQAKRISPKLTHIDAQVEGVVTDPQSGEIVSLSLDDGRAIDADFFVDCSGFRRAVIGELDPGWCSYSNELPVNRALPFWVDLEKDAEIAPFTLAWAQKHGWMWKIPTSERYGCGYVFSDAHVSADDAKSEIEGVLGHPIDVRRDIAIDAGRLKRAWVKNCAALGLASSFLEPLEATSIHGTIVQLMMLPRFMAQPQGRRDYNAAVARQVDDFKDFIRLHYVSRRRDSAFWVDVANSHPSQVKSRLEMWSHAMPKPIDFTPFPGGLPHVEQQLYTPVLDGLELLSREAAKAALGKHPKRRAQLRKAHDHLTKSHRSAAQKCLPHRAWLRSLSKDPSYEL